MTDKVVQLRPDTSGRAPPSALDSEGVVLGTLLIDCEQAFDRVYPILLPDHLYADANRRVYEAIIALQVAGKNVDPVAVANELRNQNRLNQVGGTPYLATLTDTQPVTAYVEQHVQTIVNKWKVRQVIAVGQLITAEGYGALEDEQKWIETHERSLSELAHHDRVGSLEHVAAAGFAELQRLKLAREQGKSFTGTETGLYDLDKKLGGLQDGDLVIAAGRPGMGKTSLALTLLMNIARPKPSGLPPEGVLLWSGEMPRSQVALRMVCALSGIDFAGMRMHGPSEKQWSALMNAIAELQHYPIWIDDKPARTVFEIRAIAKKLDREIRNGAVPIKVKRLGLVVSDYLQLMKGIRPPGSNREQEIASISLGLKNLAKELGVPVLALSQLNRAVEHRNSKDKRPQLSDLRESGAIENDADTIILLYRLGYYDESEQDNETELIVAKQRNGSTGTVYTRFDGPTMRFQNLDRNADFSDY